MRPTSLGSRLRVRMPLALTAMRTRLSALVSAKPATPAAATRLTASTNPLSRIPRAFMGELNFFKDQRVPQPVDGAATRNAKSLRMPITVLNHHIGKDNMPPPTFDAPFRPYKSQQVSDAFGLGIIENPMTDPFLVDKSSVTPEEDAAFKKYRYPAWGFALVRGIYRYVTQTLRGRPIWRPITDQQFCTIFSRQWPYRSLLTRHKAGDTEQEKEYVLDTSVMSKLVPYEPYFTHGCKVYFRRPKIPADADGPARGKSDLEGYRVMHIDRIVMDGGDVKKPDGTTPESQWDLAKLFAMQGAHYMIKFGQHSILHFPHDAFLRITKEFFPANSTIRQMLSPHMEFVHTINCVVLFGKMTVLNAGGRGTPWIFDIQTCDREQIQGMLRVANSQKPTFTTRALNHKLQPYYEAIGKFVHAVVDHWWLKASANEKANVKKWGAALHHYMGFPVERAPHDVNAVYFENSPKGAATEVNPNLSAAVAAEEASKVDPKDPNAFLLKDMDTNPAALKTILTDYVFRISVMHSADHWGFMQVPCNVSPMVMRVPYSRTGYINAKRMPYSRLDDLKGYLYNEVFTQWTNNRLFHDDRLKVVQYPFSDPKLQELATQFRTDLGLAELAVPYGEIPLDCVCKTLEW